MIKMQCPEWKTRAEEIMPCDSEVRSKITKYSSVPVLSFA